MNNLATASATFQILNGDFQTQIIIEVERYFGYQVWLRQYIPEIPDGVEKVLEALEGKVSLRTGFKTQKMTEMLSFNDSESQQSKYPVYSVEEIKPIKTFLTETGNKIIPNIVFNPETQRFETDQKVWGFAQIKYQSSYQTLIYMPEKSNGIPVYGHILSGIGKSFAFFKVPPPNLFTQNKFVIYEVVSEYLVNADGAWECPVDWPNGSYSYTQAPPDVEGTLKIQRVHRTGFVDNFTISFSTKEHFWFKPYFADGNYKPQYILKKAGKPTDPEMLEVYMDINWNELREELLQHYPNLKDG
jgi:hypothetical protein